MTIFSKEKVDFLNKEIVNLFNQGLNIRQISEKLKVDRHCVGRYARKLGLEYSTCNKTNINSDIFFEIDSKEKAYWLGFLLADGFVKKTNCSIELSLKLEDISHLEKFKSFLDYSGKIYTDHFRCRIIFMDCKIKQDLSKYNFINRKSLNLLFPEKIKQQKELLSSFICGYFDGDGSLTLGKTKENEFYSHCSFMGTYEFLNDLRVILEEEFNIKSVKILSTKSKAYVLQYGGAKKAYKLLNNLYEDSPVHLERKYTKYLKLKCRYT